MAEKIKRIVNFIEELAPKKYAMDWDNVGLQLGSNNDTVSRVLVCLDVTEAVLHEAIEGKIDLIISHHPLIFKPIKNVLKDNPLGSLIYKAIQHNIALYCGHTNIDVAPGGLNDYIANIVGLEDISILDVTASEVLYKLVVFIPEEYEEVVADAIASEGAGYIGNYSNCSFRSIGIGTFMGMEGTKPFIGEMGQLEKVKEVRLETIVAADKLDKVIEKMMEAHPYEEVAYDLYPLSLEKDKVGIGRVGYLSNPVTLSIFIENIKALLKLDKVRVVGDVNRSIEKVCVVNGSGADYIQSAAKAKCDCLITGDVKYHEAQMALELGINIIDAGHFETENLFTELIAGYLEERIMKEKLSVEVIKSKVYVNPFQVL